MTRRNPIATAMRGASLLPRDEVAGMVRRMRASITALCTGDRLAEAWASLADVLNVAEALADLRIGSGPEARAVIAKAQDALLAIHARAEASAGRPVALHAAEIDALHWLAALHEAQLAACSLREYERAVLRVVERSRQALAGNAGRLRIVGELT